MTGIIVLAAGASTRLGQPKQALPYQGQSLLQRATESALATGLGPVVVVLGAGAEELIPEVGTLAVHVVVNHGWATGMAGSIGTGLQELLHLQPKVEHAIIMVCDQPFAKPGVLRELVVTHQQTGKKIVASTYDQAVGTPALFHKTFFPLLLALRGQQGAKKVINNFAAEVAEIPFPEGAIDIDTPQDYENLLLRQRLEQDNKADDKNW